MNFYPWIVVVHVSGVMLFFIAHGTSAVVGLRLRSEGDPLASSPFSTCRDGAWAAPRGSPFWFGLVAGIAAGFAGGWWGHLWIWLALAIFFAVGLAMTPLTPLAEARLHEMRRAAGL